jgi:hypothetical protein
MGQTEKGGEKRPYKPPLSKRAHGTPSTGVARFAAPTRPHDKTSGKSGVETQMATKSGPQLKKRGNYPNFRLRNAGFSTQSSTIHAANSGGLSRKIILTITQVKSLQESRENRPNWVILWRKLPNCVRN